MKRDTLNKLVMKNLAKVRNFFINEVHAKSSPKPEKLSMNCPFCERVDTNHHLVINLDWGVVKCFRCGIATSIFSFLKKVGKLDDYIDFLKDISDLSTYEIQLMAKSEYIRTQKKAETIVDPSTKYIKDNHLIPAEKIREALRYAATRTRKNVDEISTYYADDKYLYIPIFRNRTVVSFIARCYIEGLGIPRYKVVNFTDKTPIGFLDEVEENVSSNTIYITEGYFDAFSINTSMRNHCSLALLSKSKRQDTIAELCEAFPPETHFIITLDSAEKDEEIYTAIDRLYNNLKGYFENISICLLDSGDPNSIFMEEGPSALVKKLQENVISAGEYLKRRLLTSNKEKHEDDNFETVELPIRLVKLAKKGRKKNDTRRSKEIKTTKVLEQAV